VLPGITYQKMQAKWLKEHEQLMKDYCKGTAYVLPNRIIRNVLSAIFAFQKQPVDYLVCKDLDGSGSVGERAVGKVTGLGQRMD
jgi:hypothetical protein